MKMGEKGDLFTCDFCKGTFRAINTADEVKEEAKQRFDIDVDTTELKTLKACDQCDAKLWSALKKGMH